MATKAQLKANANYRKKHCRRFIIDFQIDVFAKIEEAAAQAGEPVTTYIKNAINERMERGY